MDPAVVIEIDQGDRSRSGPDSSLEYRIAAASERYDGAVVIEIARAVQNSRARHSGNCTLQSINPARIAPFRKVRDTLDQRMSQRAAPAFQRVRFMAIVPSRITIPT